MGKIILKRNLFEGVGHLTQGFGENPDAYARFGLRGHNGIDYGIPVGTKLYSAINGKVTEAALDATGYGNYIKIENEYCGILYGHMVELTPLKVGAEVKAGQEIGKSGNTGNSTGPHLHFGVFSIPRDRSNGYSGYIDPFGDQVEWVDEIDSLDANYQATIDMLNNLLDETEEELELMRESRNKWRDQYGELETKYEKDMASKSSDIERLQATLQETNVAHIEATKKLNTLITKAEAEIKDYEDKYTLQKQVNLELSEQVQELPGLREEIAELKKPIKSLTFFEFLKIKLGR